MFGIFFTIQKKQKIEPKTDKVESKKVNSLNNKTLK